MGCNATWETWVLTDDVAWSGAPKQPWTHVIRPDGAVLKRVGDQAKRMQRVVIPCEMTAGHHMDELLGPDHINDEHEATWTDSTPGAASHADNTPPADEWCCDHSCDNCSGIDPASCINHRPHHPPADERAEVDLSVVITELQRIRDYSRDDDTIWSIDLAIRELENGAVTYLNMVTAADVCDNPDCENGALPPYDVADNCPSCGGTVDRPAVTDWPQWCEAWGQDVNGPHWDTSRSYDCPGPHGPPKHRPAIKGVHNHSPEDCIGCHTVYERGYSDGRKRRPAVTDAERRIVQVAIRQVLARKPDSYTVEELASAALEAAAATPTGEHR